MINMYLMCLFTIYHVLR